MRYKITAPVEGVTCTVAGVPFEDSVAETDNHNAVAYFRRHGYEVEELAVPVEPTVLEPPAGNATQEAWADWVIANVEGVDEAAVRAAKRDELREQYGPKPE